MKKAVKIFGIMLLVAIAVTGCRYIRHEREDSRSGKRAEISRMQQNRPNAPMYNMRRGMNRGGMRPGMRGGMGPGMRGGMGQGMQQGMRRGNGPGMNGGMGNGAGNGMGQGNGMMRGMRPGTGPNNRNGMGQSQLNPAETGTLGSIGISIDNIPNITEKQKKEFADLQMKQQEEMAKIRSEMVAKLKSTIESQRSKMLKLFTDEQKKFIGPQTIGKR